MKLPYFWSANIMQTHSCLMVNNNQPEHRKVAGISLAQRGFALFREAGTQKSQSIWDLSLSCPPGHSACGGAGKVVQLLSSGLFNSGHSSGSLRMSSLLLRRLRMFFPSTSRVFLQAMRKALCLCLYKCGVVVSLLTYQQFNTCVFFALWLLC